MACSPGGRNKLVTENNRTNPRSQETLFFLPSLHAIQQPDAWPAMTDASRLLKMIQQGEQASSEELLPLVYTELRRLAEVRLRRECNGHSIQATELVHEAYLRLVKDSSGDWDSQRHFLSAAAERCGGF